jgi:hypothetical protein
MLQHTVDFLAVVGDRLQPAGMLQTHHGGVLHVRGCCAMLRWQPRPRSLLLRRHSSVKCCHDSGVYGIERHIRGIQRHHDESFPPAATCAPQLEEAPGSMPTARWYECRRHLLTTARCAGHRSSWHSRRHLTSGLCHQQTLRQAPAPWQPSRHSPLGAGTPVIAVCCWARLLPCTGRHRRQAPQAASRVRAQVVVTSIDCCQSHCKFCHAG